MKNKLIIFISYIILFLNSNLFGSEKKMELKIGLLAPLTGEYADLGNSLLNSLQLALEEINDENVLIIPRDAGFNEKEKLNTAIQDIKSQGVRVIIGPISFNDFNEVKKYNDLTFISPSNITPEFTNNIISVGISLESQLYALEKFIKKQNKKKTVIMFPKNKYAEFIKQKISKLNLNEIKSFQYNPDPQVLTGEIEILTNYSQRKKEPSVKKENV